MMWVARVLKAVKELCDAGVETTPRQGRISVCGGKGAGRHKGSAGHLHVGLHLGPMNTVLDGHLVVSEVLLAVPEHAGEVVVARDDSAIVEGHDADLRSLAPPPTTPPGQGPPLDHGSGWQRQKKSRRARTRRKGEEAQTRK